MNADLKLLRVYDKLDGKISLLQEQVSDVRKLEGPQGEKGEMGPQGPVGPSGKDGQDGVDGKNGSDGRDGIDGKDGTGITNVELDFDNHLRVTLSDGTVLDVGQIETPEATEGATQIISMGGGSSSGNESFNDVGTISSTTYVTSLADLPPPSSGVITLEADHTYFFIGTVDLQGNRMVGQFNTCILGYSSENAFITSTGLGAGVALFTTAWTTPIRHVTFKDVDTALDIDGLGNDPVALDWTGVNFTNVPNIGVIKDVGNFIFTKGAFLSSQGLSFDGTFGTISIADSLLQGTGAAGAIVTLPSTLTVTRRFRIIYSSIVAFGFTTGLDVSTSASIPVEGYILDTINFSGGSTYQAGVTFEDNKALFVRCRGITNSREVSQYYMNGNLTTTNIASSGVAYKVEGATTSNARTSKFTNTDNRATYIGAFSRNFYAVATLSMSSSTNQLIGSYIAKNGTILTESEIYLQTDNNGDITNVTIQALVDLDTNDYIEVFVENASSSSNITVSDMNVTIQ